MEEFLKKVKDGNSYLLNTWIPAGQDYNDKQVETMAGEIMGGEEAKASNFRECEFRYVSSGDKKECVYNEEKFEALDAVSKETLINLYLFETLIEEKYNPERIQFKFVNDLKAKYGFN